MQYSFFLSSRKYSFFQASVSIFLKMKSQKANLAIKPSPHISFRAFQLHPRSSSKIPSGSDLIQLETLPRHHSKFSRIVNNLPYFTIHRSKNDFFLHNGSHLDNLRIVILLVRFSFPSKLVNVLPKVFTSPHICCNLLRYQCFENKFGLVILSSIVYKMNQKFVVFYI